MRHSYKMGGAIMPFHLLTTLVGSKGSFAIDSACWAALEDCNLSNEVCRQLSPPSLVAIDEAQCSNADLYHDQQLLFMPIRVFFMETDL